MPRSKPPRARKPPSPARASKARGGAALTLPQALQKATTAYRAGHGAEAERLCRRILEAKPDSFDALTLMGAIAAQSGRPGEAEALFGRAVAANPANARAHHNRGIIQAGLGRFGDALASFDRAIAIEPGYAEAHDNRGNALRELGRLDEALASYDRATALAPRAAVAHGNRAVALRELGRPDEALASVDRAIALDPGDAAAHSNRGVVLMALERPAEALASFDRAIAIDPGDAELHGNRGNALKQLRRLDDALASYARAIELNPGDAAAHSNYGVALRDLRRSEDALASFDRAIARAPDLATAHSNRGNALMDLGRLDEALASLDRAIELRPDYAEAHSNRGVVLRCLERLEDARASFARALDVKPDQTDADWNLTVMHLLAGEFGPGWAGYLRRPDPTGLLDSVSRDRLGSTVAGKRVFVLGEQGLGDEIFFLRFVATLKRLGAWIAYRCDPRLAGMLGRLPFIDRIVGSDEAPESVDHCFAAGDLPYILGMNRIADVPPPIALTPDAQERKKAGDLLGALGPPPYIGVAWRAGPGEKGTLSKAAPPERLGAALRPVAGTVVSVQRLPSPDDVALFGQALGRPAHDLSAMNTDLDAMLALMDALDDLVCVSNTNVHLRTSCGRTCRVLVPNPPEFRWMQAGPESPWFPGTRLYRQSHGRGWDEAFAILAADLAASYPAAS